MASPELYPSAGIPFTGMEVYMLNRVSVSAPYTLVKVMNCPTGAMAPLSVRTNMLLSDSLSKR